MGRPNQGGHVRRLGGSARYRLVRVQVDGKSKQVLEHRHIMEQHLGRKLLSTEHVHHKDHDGLNNALDNLELVSARDHQRIHLMGTKKWPSDEGAKLREEGWTIEQIADKYGVAPRTVLMAFRVRGISTANKRDYYEPKWNAEEALKLRADGWPWKRIAAHFGCSTTAIRIGLKRRGLL
jgi:hypothetical protein